jgi:hypothetical protein
MKQPEDVPWKDNFHISLKLQKMFHGKTTSTSLSSYKRCSMERPPPHLSQATKDVPWKDHLHISLKLQHTFLCSTSCHVTIFFTQT